MYAYAQEGISLPHSSYAQWDYGTAVPAPTSTVRGWERLRIVLP